MTNFTLGIFSEDIKMIFSYHNTPIYYSDQGSGPTLLLLHGFLESSTMWKLLVPAFIKKYRVVTIDFPGHGKSASIADVHSMELFAEMVSALIQHLKINEATVMGHSMGGYVSMALAELHPEQIKTLILLTSSPAADSEVRKQNRMRALQLVPKAKDAFVSMAISNLFSEHSRERFDKEISEAKAEAVTISVEGITAAIKGMKDRNDRTVVLEEFDKPKFMICGTYDPILPILECKTIAKQTNTVLFEVEGSHMIHIENRSEIVKIMHLIENNCI